MASGVADAIFIKQLLSEIQEYIGIKTFDIPDHHPVTNKPVPAITVLTDSTSATSLVQRMGLNRRSKHIELKFLWLQDHHKNGVTKVKRVSSLENPADIFTKDVSASTLVKHLLAGHAACGLQELRVGEGDDNNHHIFHLLTDTKFRKGFHQVQAQAPALHLQQEAEEQEIDNIFDMDICMIETEDNTTTPPTTTTASTEKTAMQILAEVLQRQKQQQQKRKEQQQQQIQQQQVEQQVFREHHHPITSRLLTTTTSTPTMTPQEPQERDSSERRFSLSSVSSCPRRKRRTSSPGRARREGEKEEEKEEHPHQPSSLAIVPVRRHQRKTIIVATSSLILFTSSLSFVLASSLPFAIKTLGSINHLYRKVSPISSHLQHLEGHLLGISGWSISNISCSSCWNLSSNIKSIFSKMAGARSVDASQMQILEAIVDQEEQQIIEDSQPAEEEASPVPERPSSAKPPKSTIKSEQEAKIHIVDTYHLQHPCERLNVSHSTIGEHQENLRQLRRHLGRWSGHHNSNGRL